MSRRKQVIFAVSFLILGFSLGVFATAVREFALGPSFGRPPGKAAQERQFERMIEKFSMYFELNEEQRPLVRQAFVESRERMFAFHREAFPRTVQIRQATFDKIRSVLTPEQLAKFDAAHERYLARMKKEFKETGGIPPPPPPPHPPDWGND